MLFVLGLIVSLLGFLLVSSGVMVSLLFVVWSAAFFWRVYRLRRQKKQPVSDFFMALPQALTASIQRQNEHRTAVDMALFRRSDFMFSAVVLGFAVYCGLYGSVRILDAGLILPMADFSGILGILLIAEIFVMSQWIEKKGRALRWLLVLWGAGALYIFAAASFVYDLAHISRAPMWGLGWGRVPMLQDVGLVPAQVQSHFAVRVYELGWLGALAFYLSVIGFIVQGFLLPYLKKRVRMKAALFGVALLCALLFFDLFVVHQEKSFVFWVVSWAVLGIFFARIAKGHYAVSRHGRHRGVRLAQL